MYRGFKFIFRLNTFSPNNKNKFDKVVGSAVEVTLKASDRGVVVHL